MKTREELINLGIEGYKADEIMLLQEKMLDRAVAFQYKKKDGTIRNAVGTLCLNLMKLADNTLWTPKGNEKPEPATVIRYFDCDKAQWRCFTCTDYIAMEG